MLTKHSMDGQGAVAKGRARLLSPSTPLSPLPSPALFTAQILQETWEHPAWSCNLSSNSSLRLVCRITRAQPWSCALRLPSGSVWQRGIWPLSCKSQALADRGHETGSAQILPKCVRQIATSEDVPCFKICQAPKTQTGSFKVLIYNRPFFA